METRALETIKPYWRNPRKNADAVAAVKASIERYGMQQPIVVDQKGIIIVGHTRYRALLELGADKAPVIVADLPAKLAKEYRIADNKTNELAQWDAAALIPELRDIDISSMEIFFPDVDLGALIADDAGASYSPVQQEQVDAILDRKGNGILKQTLGDKIKLECIHCGGELYVDRSTIEKHGGER
jgi:hypothetical protein